MWGCSQLTRPAEKRHWKCHPKHLCNQQLQKDLWIFDVTKNYITKDINLEDECNINYFAESGPRNWGNKLAVTWGGSVVVPARLRTLKVDIPGICLSLSFHPCMYLIAYCCWCTWMNLSYGIRWRCIHTHIHIVYSHIPVYCDGKKHIYTYLTQKTV